MADLDPILDGLRLIKSPREIALVREATRLSGVAIAEAIRSARPGQRENDLEAIADYVFKQGGAQGFAYFALAAAGTNAHYPHYHGGEAELKSGDLVLFDYAPDYRYYSSDVTRMFPVSGHFSPEQKERYTVYLRMYQALMESIKPASRRATSFVTPWSRWTASSRRSASPSDVNKQAAVDFVERYRKNTRNSLGHMVGMEVHDVQPASELLLARA